METILSLIAKDHHEIRQLIQQLEKNLDLEASEKERIFFELSALLKAHTFAEEEVLYEKLLNQKQGVDQTLEGYEEHRVADFVLQDLSNTSAENAAFIPKVKVLRESLDHHLKEEEEKLFPVARSTFRADQLSQMGHQFTEKKALGSSVLPQAGTLKQSAIATLLLNI